VKTAVSSSRMSRSRSGDIVNHLALEKAAIAIIGAGAIGSNTAYLLAKLGVGRLVIFDDDSVEEENIEPQFFTPGSVGQHKVSAVHQIVSDFVSDVAISSVPSRVVAETVFSTKTIVSGVDSIESRKEIARALFDQRDHWSYYIDARMGGNIIELYFVTPETLDVYWSALLKAEPLDIPCSARATSYNGMLMASVVARYVAAISKGQPVPSYLHVDLLAWSFAVGRLQEPTAVL
jgi:molybdopterin/thiamine biosynthesis adenylyltransferase